MNSFTSDDFGFTFLEEGISVQDFIEQKNQELSMLDSEDAFFVADLGELVKKHQRWVRSMPRVTPFYAVKCNDSRPVVMTLATLGTGFDCASRHEIELVTSLGVDPSRIIYANTCKQASHLKYAADQGIQMMTFDSEAELVKIARCYKDAKLVLRIAADDSDSLLTMSDKFGATMKTGWKLLERGRWLDLDIIGVSFHVGSACTNPDTYRKAISDARAMFDVGKQLGYKMTLLDLGGGFPGYDIPDLFVFKEFAAVINAALEEYFPADSDVRVIAEPGRYYPSSTYTLAVKIIGKKVDIKEPSGDEGPQKKRKLNERTYPSTIFGQTCDGHDLIVEEFDLPDLQVGEWLLFYNMGAYTVTTSTTFNGFPQPDIHYVMSRSAWQRVQQIYAAQGLCDCEEAGLTDAPASDGKPRPARLIEPKISGGWTGQ
ncbi:ornithine decarboxylase 1-like isoform X2 [Conger conger]|uniref:ornithine decarboxylase 1-like isoform X2 n=1 Tax=Conger conger TaxID=82655 RepID=UPI002A5A193C|nr:ornithine decarboxylase 1-like isoform X2 [Conger conger]